jgi:hypothetical protein
VVNVTWTGLDSLVFSTFTLTVFVLSRGWFAVSVKQNLGHCPWLMLWYHWQMLQL